ncbi:MAG: diversity-generating retroelement protein Avd [Candidatus Margulisiibacteriota bacterium]
MIESANSIAKTYDLIRWLMPTVSKFPKCKRYTLGQRIENNILDILALLLEANYSKEKLNILKQANLKLEVFRHLIRLSYDLRFINIRRYELISKETNEIGRLIGGWIKQQSAR